MNHTNFNHFFNFNFFKEIQKLERTHLLPTESNLSLASFL